MATRLAVSDNHTLKGFTARFDGIDLWYAGNYIHGWDNFLKIREEAKNWTNDVKVIVDSWVKLVVYLRKIGWHFAPKKTPETFRRWYGKTFYATRKIWGALLEISFYVWHIITLYYTMAVRTFSGY